MDGNDEDEFYADDGFDSLAQDELLKLEQNALQATQQQHDGTDGGGYLKVPRHTLLHQQHTIGVRRNPAFDRTQLTGRHAPPPQRSSVYDDFDPEDIDTVLLDDSDEPVPVEEKEGFVPPAFPDEAVQREQWRQQRYAQPGRSPQSRGPPAIQQHLGRHLLEEHNPDSGFYEPGQEVHMQDARLDDVGEMIQIPEANPNVEAAALRAQIQELLRERERLRIDISTANSNSLAKTGEIAIIRANQSKAVVNYDRQIAALQRSIAEEAVHHKSNLEAALRESTRIQTENQFLKQDLSEEAERIKTLKRDLKGKDKSAKEGPAITPRKSLALQYRDGFDDDEIALASPSKSGRRSKKGTPSAGAKRKRRVTHDSPIQPLELTEVRQVLELVEEPLVMVEELVTADETRTKPQAYNENLQFMQRMLNHRSHPSHERLLEAFTKYSLPDEPRRTLSSIIFESASVLNPDNFRTDFTKIIIQLWKTCLEKKYHDPVNLLIDLIKYILAQDALGIAPHVIEDVVPVAQEAGNINGIPRFKNSPVSHQSLGRFNRTPLKQLDPLVDATECLNVLYAAGTGCLHEDSSIRHFWQLMKFDFVLMMLNSFQPIADITINLGLLSTSIFPKTFGPILVSAKDQAASENYIIERISCLLMETPVVDEGEDLPLMTEICELRIEALSLLSELALSSPHPHDPADPSGEPHHGSVLLARHATCLARLIRSIYDELEMLYTDPPTARLHCVLINNATRLVYRIFKLHPEQIDMKPKWGAVPGGLQKQLIVLSRLAFSEGPWLERGIEDEVMEMAHELLEDVVNLEEAAMVVQAFPHMARAGGSSGTKETQDIDEDEEMAAADADG